MYSATPVATSLQMTQYMVEAFEIGSASSLTITDSSVPPTYSLAYCIMASPADAPVQEQAGDGDRFARLGTPRSEAVRCGASASGRPEDAERAFDPGTIGGF